MIKGMLKGVMYAVVCTLLFILGFALVMKWANLSNDVVKPIMQVVKVLCIFIGVAIALKHISHHGWLYGGIIGILYMVFTFIIFSLVDGNFVLGINALSDLLFQTLAGVISALVLRIRNKDVEVA